MPMLTSKEPSFMEILLQIYTIRWGFVFSLNYCRSIMKYSILTVVILARKTWRPKTKGINYRSRVLPGWLFSRIQGWFNAGLWNAITIPQSLLRLYRNQCHKIRTIMLVIQFCAVGLSLSVSRRWNCWKYLIFRIWENLFWKVSPIFTNWRHLPGFLLQSSRTSQIYR